MGKVTSKLQLTLPKAIADQFGIRPGDDLRWEAADEIIRVVPERSFKASGALTLEERLALFDAATARQSKRQSAPRKRSSSPANRGWTREELYSRGRTD
jgi:AbrB family looped-hinge helix DNA binding protein